MEEFSVTLDDASDASSITAAVVMSRIEENRLSNRALLENFLGMRPLRRHASMRPTYSTLSKTKTIEEESSLLKKKGRPEQRDEDEGVYRGLSNRYDDWSFSVPELSEAQPYSLKVRVPERSSVDKQSSKRGAVKGRLSSLACVRCVVGGQPGQTLAEQDNDERQDKVDQKKNQEALSAGSSVISKESDVTSKNSNVRTDEWETQITVPKVDLLALWNCYMSSTTNKSNKKQEFQQIQCIAPCDPVSFDSYDSYAYALSDGSSIKDENIGESQF